MNLAASLAFTVLPEILTGLLFALKQGEFAEPVSFPPHRRIVGGQIVFDGW